MTTIEEVVRETVEVDRGRRTSEDDDGHICPSC